MKTISNTVMKNGSPVFAVPDFQPDHRPFGGCDGAVLWPEVARMLSLTNRTEARIVKVSPPA
jgi:hypothetical protein